jgi:hypothetical protein
MSLNKTQSAALATGCVLSFRTSEKTPQDAENDITLNHSQLESAARANSGASFGTNELPGELAKLPVTLDELRDAVRECRDLTGPIRDAILALLSTL